jgi:TonB-dependent starch-binding outer membrane protein SusC
MIRQISRFAPGVFFALFFTLFCFDANAQKEVSGQVLSGKDNKPIAGASIVVKGSTEGTQTAGDGSFKITLPATKSILVVTAINFESREVATAGKTSVTVELTESASSLNEVVVIGYGTQKRKDLSGAVSSVSAATIEKVPVVTLDQALQGRASGVQVTNNDGAPGGNISVLIRGVGSLAGNGNNPLYIVDGYPITGGINNINPADIATIDVLKDASTAIYGIRAANGVIIVTTKKGKKNGTQVSLDAYSAFQGQPKKYDILNAQQFATLANEVEAADPGQNFKVFAPWKTPTSLANVSWQDALYRTGLTQSYNIALRGGNDKAQSAISLGYYDQKGIVKESFFKRYTLGLNLDYTPNKWLKSSTSVRYAYQNSNTAFGTGALVQLTQLPPTLDGGSSITNQIKDGAGNYGFYNPVYTYVAKYSNPLFSIETNEYKNVSNYILVNSSLEAMLYDGLKIKTMAGVNVSQYSGSYYQPEDGRLFAQYGSLAGATQNPLYNQRTNQTFEWLWENTVSYEKTFGSHSINFVGGVSAQKNTFTANGGSGVPPNSVIRDLGQVRTGTLNLDRYGNGQTIYTLASEFARLSYKFKDKYSLQGIVRRDGSSKFDTGHQYGVFPSISASWNAKKESFLEGVNWLNDLKLRVSWGILGNESAIGVYQYQAQYVAGAPASSSGNLGYPFNKLYQSGIAQIQPANPLLRWEEDEQTDIGFDAAFLQGNLTVTVDYFDRKSKDFLLKLAAPAQSGYNELTRNVGSMVNKGLEMAFNYNHRVNKDLNYNAGLTLTTVKNKLTSIVSGTTFVSNFGGVRPAGNNWDEFGRTFIGQSVGEFYGYKSLGIFQTQAQIDALNAASKAKDPNFPNYWKPVTVPGDRYFADVNGDGHVNSDDRVSLGSPLPKFYGGLNLDVTYKSWDFNAYFYGVFGNKILNYQKSSLQSFQNRSFVGVQNVSKEFYDNHWTPTRPSNTFSRASYNDDAAGSNVPSSAWIEDGGFTKLKNLTVGYTLPSGFVTKYSITKARFYLSTQNLFTITNYSGLDPEIGIQGGNATQNGVDNGTYPGSKFVTLGLNVTF